MRFEPNLTTDAVLKELGRRVERQRLERNLTQDELAEEAGIGRATLQRLERGESVQLTSLIGLLRELGLLERLDVLVPEPTPSPLERLKTQGQRRQRARARRIGPEPTRKRWTWGDDAPDHDDTGAEGPREPR
jgi:transcriptional regulator with XRE-family HTH domain